MLAGLSASLRVFSDLVDGGVDYIGGGLRVGVGGADGRGNDAVDLVIGVGEVFVEVRTPEYDDEAVGLDGVDLHLCAFHLDIVEETAEFPGLCGGEAAGAAVGDHAVLVDGAEVATCGKVVGGEFHADAGGLKDAALYEVGDGVVAEEGKMAGATAGDDAPGHGYGEATHGLGSDVVQIGGVGSLKLGLAGVGVGESAEAVENKEDDL